MSEMEYTMRKLFWWEDLNQAADSNPIRNYINKMTLLVCNCNVFFFLFLSRKEGEKGWNRVYNSEDNTHTCMHAYIHTYRQTFTHTGMNARGG